MLRYWNSILLLVFLFFLANTSFAAEYALIEKFKIIINHQFHLDANHNFKFYEFPNKDEEHIIKNAQEMIIKDIISNNSGVFYEVKLSQEPYHQYIDALLFYLQVGKDYITDLTEEERLFIQRHEEETKQQEEDKLKKEELVRLEKTRLRTLINSKIGEKLPANYKGHNIEKVFWQLLTTYPVKGEFEKTSEYEKRVSAFTYNDIYAFRIDDKHTPKFIYDSDNEQLKVDLETRDIFIRDPLSDGSLEKLDIPIEDIISNTFEDIIDIKSAGEKVSTYIGTNAFGAKTVIKKYTGDLYGLAPKEKKYSISIRIKPAEAKKYKNRLKVLLICKASKNDKLNRPAFTGLQYFPPTFNTPIEMHYVAKIINVEILELWIYDYNTGKILGKQEFY